MWLSARAVYFAVHGVKPPRRSPRRPTAGRGPARSWRYKAWIRTLPCAVCGREGGIEAAHTGADGGRGQKSSDYSCIPLCFDHHQADGRRAYHGCAREEFEQQHNLNIAGLVKSLNQAWFTYSGDVK